MTVPMQLQAHNYTGLTQVPPYPRYAYTIGATLLAAVGPLNTSTSCVTLHGLDPTVPAAWMQPLGGLRYGVKGNPHVEFVPYYQVQEETFDVYPVIQTE
mmetsp:Transcript_42690/g.92786  ORF Transcript_42690/g.92786 Transcript_42690/m.92786 type:complete len:99 (-) Transcript_42690:23-319(-)